MLAKNLVLALLSFLFFAGLAAWQLQRLEESRQLRQEIFQHQLEEKLQVIGPVLRKETAWGLEVFKPAYLTEASRAQACFQIDSIMQQHFGSEANKLLWAVVQGAHDSLLLSNAPAERQHLVAKAGSRKCLSCLVLITKVDDGGQILMEHSVAQMESILGWEMGKIRQLAILYENQAVFSWTDALAFLFMAGLSMLFGISLYLNARQKRLIAQKNEFINHLSHQFKTPLASIRLGTKMLLQSSESLKDKEMLHIMNLEGNRLEKHVQTVLQWVRSGSQGLQLAPQPLNMIQFTQLALTQMEPIFRDKQTRVETDFPLDLPEAMADEYHLMLVYFNIWENAVKHNTDKHKKELLQLKISLRLEGRFIVVRHQDNGNGFRNEKARTADVTGLGLLYIKRVMKAHRGSLDIWTRKGEGSILSLKLPLA